jgi:ribosomal-protein-alanine N-acetyltransferase
VNEVLALRGNPKTMKFIPRPLVTTTKMALEHIEMIAKKIEDNIGINWAITLKGNPKLIGIIGHYRIQPENYRSEIGYMLLPKFHNQGITSEAISLVLNYSFNHLNFHSVEAVVDPENFGSINVLEKNGFIKEAHFLENEYWDGKFWDSAVYSLLNRNFKKKY